MSEMDDELAKVRRHVRHRESADPATASARFRERLDAGDADGALAELERSGLVGEDAAMDAELASVRRRSVSVRRR